MSWEEISFRSFCANVLGMSEQDFKDMNMSFDKKNRGVTKAAKEKPVKADAKELKEVKPIKVSKKGKRVYKA